MNEKYKLYCKVLVKTGETGIIVESYNDGEAYEIELPIFRYLSFFNRKLLSFVIFFNFCSSSSSEHISSGSMPLPSPFHQSKSFKVSLIDLNVIETAKLLFGIIN